MLALVVAVVAVHGCVASSVAERMADFAAAESMPPRMDVAYVRELAPAAPPPVADAPAVSAQVPAPAVAQRAPRPAAAAASTAAGNHDAEQSVATVPDHSANAPADPASSPESASLLAAAEAGAAPADVAKPASTPPPSDAGSASAPTPAVGASDTLASMPEVVTSAPPALAASSPDAAAAVAAALAGFDWPVSTRLSYRLTGYFRGEVTGTAQVEWIRKGARYQVHLDMTIGPAIAPLLTWRLSSDGDITPAGLSPRRFDQLTKTVLRDPQHQTLLFDGDTVILSNGERRDRPAGVQDLTSQFVQLSYLFGQQPDRLRVGTQIDMPLALARKVERWVYDVKGEETLSTPIGELATFHLVPRREAGPAPGDRIMETWYAPSLRYLPVRIRIQQDADTFVDLQISRRPEIAAL